MQLCCNHKRWYWIWFKWKFLLHINNYKWLY